MMFSFFMSLYESRTAVAKLSGLMDYQWSANQQLATTFPKIFLNQCSQTFLDIEDHQSTLNLRDPRL